MNSKEAKQVNTAVEPQILIAAPDDSRTAALVSMLVPATRMRVTHVASIADARSAIDIIKPHVILANDALDDGDGIDLVAGDGRAAAPIVLLQEVLSESQLLKALRLGVADVFEHPIDADALVESVRTLAHRESIRRREQRRARRLRRMSSRLVRDRRELRQRVDLICNDIVVAYRQLAEKVVSMPVWTHTDENPRQRA